MADVIPISQQALICKIAIFTSRADLIFRHGNRWTMFLYGHLDKVDIKFVEKIENLINLEYRKIGLPMRKIL